MFNLAFSILMNNDAMPDSFDKDSLTMVWSDSIKFDESRAELSVAQLWNKPSFNGAPAWRYF